MNTLIRLLNRPEYLLRPGNLFRRVALRYLYRGKNVVVRLKNGCRIEVREGEFHGNQIINTRCHDAALSEFLWRLIRKGDTCVDVGANIGYVSLLMAARCGEPGRCLAFEADPGVFGKLNENIRLNGFTQITAVNAAVSDREGMLTFQPAPELNCGLGRISAEGAEGFGCFQVRAIRLDDTLAAVDRIRVVKIDVEGHELQVLRGIRAAIESKKIECIVFEEHGGAGAETVGLLGGKGYTIFRLSLGLRGPRLLSPDADAGRDMMPNFVATLDPGSLQNLMNAPGWNVL